MQLNDQERASSARSLCKESSILLLTRFNLLRGCSGLQSTCEQRETTLLAVSFFDNLKFTYDENGNSDSATRWINVVDRIAPEITLVDDEVIFWPRWQDFQDPGAAATDNYDASSAIDLTETNDVDVQSEGIYTVTYTAKDQSGNTSTTTRTVIVENPTSVGTVADFGMEIFPNPSAGQFRLNVNLTETERLTVTVFDALGKAVYTTDAGMVDHYENTINLTHLESGIYMVHVVTPTQKQVKMVQIQK